MAESKKSTAKAVTEKAVTEKAVTQKAEAGTTATRGRRKFREGTVVSDKMDKTIVVTVTRLEQHPIYKKYVHKTKKYYVHDEKGLANIGDLVRITETRPISKLKRWKLVDVVKKAVVGLPKTADAA